MVSMKQAKERAAKRKHQERFQAEMAAAIKAVVSKFPKNNTDQASHLCHNGNCVNCDHLRWEGPLLNAERKKCEAAGECSGHGPGVPDCTF